MIECPKCQHDNDLGRIFCVKCGEKLDISKVTAPSGVRRRAGKKNKGSQTFARKLSKGLGKMIKLMFLAATTAALTLLALPSKVEKKGFGEANIDAFQEKLSQFEEAATTLQETTITISEDDFNAAMAHAVQNSAKPAEVKKATTDMKLVIDNVYISLQDQGIWVTLTNRWKWFRLSSQIRAKLENKSGKWQFVPDKAFIGRLRIPPQLNEKVFSAFSALWKDLERDKQLFENLNSVEIKPGEMTLTTKSS